MSVFSILAVDYFYHLLHDLPVREPTPQEVEMMTQARRNAFLSSSEEELKPESSTANAGHYLDRRMQLMAFSLALSTLLLFIR